MKLPPLRALPVFEAVARLNSFSLAAEELSVSQSAVSHQIKQLETYLGEKLFWRQGRTLTLTDEGRQYLDAVGSALLQIERASEQLLGREEARLRLSVFSSFAVRWLVPRLPELQRLHPQVELSLEMSTENPVLSDRVVVIPELAGDEGVILARHGFNVIATSNSIDEGVHAMSAALKRRMDFEEIRPIRQVDDEIDVVLREVRRANAAAGVTVAPDPAVIEVLVTLFHELRNGQTLDGRSTDRLAGSALSTAEAVAVAHAASLNAWYYGGGAMTVEHLMHHVIGSALKDQPEDRRRLRHYFETAVAQRTGEHWRQVWALRSLIV